MRSRWGFIACCSLLLCAGAWAQANKPANQPKEERRPPTKVLDQTVKNLEEEFIPAAEAMPEDKFDFAPSDGEFKGVRTYAQQIKHVAAVNYEIAAAILEQKPPVDIHDEAGPDSIKSKEEILKYLKDSFVYVHRAIATIDDKNLVETVRSPFGEGKVTRMGLACSIAWHGYDHYGQMVVYLRMNGIIPPASRH